MLPAYGFGVFFPSAFRSSNGQSVPPAAPALQRVPPGTDMSKMVEDLVKQPAEDGELSLALALLEAINSLTAAVEDLTATIRSRWPATTSQPVPEAQAVAAPPAPVPPVTIQPFWPGFAVTGNGKAAPTAENCRVRQQEPSGPSV